MDLAKILSGRSDQGQEYYWAIVIKPGWVDCGIWGLSERGVSVVASSGSVSWEDGTNALLEALDNSLTIASQNFKEEGEAPKKAVFGVVPSWVSEGKIKSDHLEQLRHICLRLDLEPTGFVVLPEAIGHLIHEKEGTPVNAVLIGIDEEELSVSLFRLGILVGTSTVSRSVSIVEDVEEGLSRFPLDEPFPSRLILFDSRTPELEDLRQSLLDSDWKKEKVKFLHTPKVETLAPQDLVLATGTAGASEIGGVEREEKKEVPKRVPSPQGEEVEEPQPQVEDAAANFGFVVGADVGEERASAKDLDEKEKSIRDTESPEPQAEERQRFDPRIFLGKLAGFFEKVPRSFPKFSFLKGHKVLGLVAFLLTSLFVLSISAWWYLPKAQVTLYISPLKISKEFEVTVDQTASTPDFSTKVLPGKLIETEVLGEKSKEATGTKLVGERSQGTVKFFNTGESLAVSSGTVLLGPGNLKFTVDDGVQIASGSAAIRGEGVAKVTAADIGTQYNLATGGTFVVGSFPSSRIEGVNEGAFTGGSSSEVVVVSKEDQEDLLADLVEELKDKGESDLKTKISSNQLLLEKASVGLSILNRNFSKAVGEEASSVTLKLAARASALVVERSDFFEFLKKEFEESTPSGFVLKEENLAVSFESSSQEKDGNFILQSKANANLLPDVKLEEIAEAIKGKYPRVAKEYLTTIAGFKRAEIILKPPLPSPFAILPRSSKRISVMLAAQE